MRKYTVPVVTLFLLTLLSCSRREESEQKLHQMREEVLSNLITNILPFWEIYSPDPSGGFYGTILNDGTPVADAEKGLVLNARILWAFSSAYRSFEVENYRQLADRAQKYLIDHFIDPEYGGVYWSVTSNGEPADTNKQTYGIAFAIYGLSEHYRATGNENSLEHALDLYDILLKMAYDRKDGGYIDTFTRNWRLPGQVDYESLDPGPKTMNTQIHVLEAFTNLYRACPDNRIKKRLEDLVNLFCNEIINSETNHQRLFFTKDCHYPEEVNSYAHDIEISWLLYEAAQTIGDESLIDRTKQIAINLVETQLREAWTPEGYLLLEKSNGQPSSKIEWWPQAEAVVAFINAWQLTGDPAYAHAATTTWNWIRDNLVDHEYGEWYHSLDKNHMPITTRPKANMWKCPYHNSRMAFETITRIQWKEENKP